jgi:hypothetical protein
MTLSNLTRLKLAWFSQVIDAVVGPHGRGQLPVGSDAGRGGARADVAPLVEDGIRRIRGSDAPW